LVWSG